MESYRDQLQSEAIKALEKRRCTIICPPRSGKTLVMLRVSTRYNRVLVSYPNKPILDSWLTDAVKFNIDIGHIDFTTHRSLEKHDLGEYDCLTIDEIDTVSQAQWQKLASQIVRNPSLDIKGATGTPPRKGSVKKLYIDTYCPINFVRTIEQTTGLTNKDYSILVHKVKPSEVPDIPTKNGFWSEKNKIDWLESKLGENFFFTIQLIQTISGSKSKWDKLVEIVNSLDRCLILVETHKQAELISKHSYHSKNKDSKKNLEMFQSGEINKLSCVGQLSAGISFKDLKHAVLLHTYASSTKAAQRVARALDYVEGVKAEVHLICMSFTKDESWTKNGISYYDSSKIKWI